MKKRRLGIVGLLAIGLVLVLSSCGGGSSKRLTKEQFAAKANALCVSFNNEVKKAGSPATTAQAIAYFNKLLPLDKKLVADVDKLKPPAGDEASVNRIVTLGKEQVTRAEALVAAIQKKDLTLANKLSKEGSANSKESKTLFNKLGIKECAKSS
jgi:hypothetical protein